MKPSQTEKQSPTRQKTILPPPPQKINKSNLKKNKIKIQPKAYQAQKPTCEAHYISLKLRKIVQVYGQSQWHLHSACSGSIINFL